MLRKLLDDLGARFAYDRIDYWSLQLDSGMVAEIRFVEPDTLPKLVNVIPYVACCAHEIGDVVCACLGGDGWVEANFVPSPRTPLLLLLLIGLTLADLG